MIIHSIKIEYFVLFVQKNQDALAANFAKQIPFFYGMALMSFRFSLSFFTDS